MNDTYIFIPALGLSALPGGGNFAAAQRRFDAQPDLALNLVLRA